MPVRRLADPASKPLLILSCIIVVYLGSAITSIITIFSSSVFFASDSFERISEISSHGDPLWSVSLFVSSRRFWSSGDLQVSDGFARSISPRDWSFASLRYGANRSSCSAALLSNVSWSFVVVSERITIIKHHVSIKNSLSWNARSEMIIYVNIIIIYYTYERESLFRLGVPL